jgi:hypothetical protein
MRTLLCLLSGAVLLTSAAHGQTYIYPETPQCLNHTYTPTLYLPGSQPIPIAIRAHAYDGAQVFEFSIPGFTPEAGILVTDVAPNPEALVAEGNPFAEGAFIALATCESTPVTLYTATLFVRGSGVTVTWDVAAHSSPRDPASTCPTAYPCRGGTSCIFPGVARTHAIVPYAPFPPDGATNVPLDVTLNYGWDTGTCSCLGVACFSLWLGTDPDPPLFFGICDMPLPDLGLKPSTTYYWRAGVSFCGSVVGPVWSFTTAPPIGVEPVTWSNVKKLFR